VSTVHDGGTYGIYDSGRYALGETLTRRHQTHQDPAKDATETTWLDFRQAPSWLSSNQWIANRPALPGWALAPLGRAMQTNAASCRTRMPNERNQ